MEVETALGKAQREAHYQLKYATKVWYETRHPKTKVREVKKNIGVFLSLNIHLSQRNCVDTLSQT